MRSFDFVLVAAFALTLVGGVGWLLIAGADRSIEPPPRVGERPVPPRPRDASPPAGDLPAFGQYVHVDEFPRPIRKVTPEYPEEALARGLEGNVVIQALVGADGRVHETRVVNPDPVFDPVAVAAVRQYVFEPAKSGGKPVAVWVAIPIRFKLE